MMGLSGLYPSIFSERLVSARSEGDIAWVSNSNVIGGVFSSSKSFEGRWKAKVGVGSAWLVFQLRAGLGNGGILKIEEAVLRRAGFLAGGDEGGESYFAASGEKVSSRSKRARDNVGELGVNEARRVVGFSLTSGANMLELGGRGRDRTFETFRPSGTNAPSIELVSGDSSCMPFRLDGLGDRLHPSIVGASDIRTQFCRR